MPISSLSMQNDTNLPVSENTDVPLSGEFSHIQTWAVTNGLCANKRFLLTYLLTRTTTLEPTTGPARFRIGYIHYSAHWGSVLTPVISAISPIAICPDTETPTVAPSSDTQTLTFKYCNALLYFVTWQDCIIFLQRATKQPTRPN